MSFPITVPIEVRFGDLDALGHVNNAIYLTYDEIARMHYLRRVGAMIDSGHFVMARAEVDYLKPVVLNQKVELSLRVTRVGNKSFQTLGELRADGVLSARTVVVAGSFMARRVARAHTGPTSGPKLAVKSAMRHSTIQSG